jgi:hypothetical protein
MAVRNQAATSLLLLAAAARTALAHENHMDDIPEGQGVSAEPLVSLNKAVRGGEARDTDVY